MTLVVSKNVITTCLSVCAPAGVYSTLQGTPHRSDRHHSPWLHRNQWWQLYDPHRTTGSHGLQVCHVHTRYSTHKYAEINFLLWHKPVKLMLSLEENCKYTHGRYDTWKEERRQRSETMTFRLAHCGILYPVWKNVHGFITCEWKAWGHNTCRGLIYLQRSHPLCKCSNVHVIPEQAAFHEHYQPAYSHTALTVRQW